MQLGIGPHVEEGDLEQYSLGVMLEERLAPFEEHLLTCDGCQDRLLEMETYVNAVRSVSPKLRNAKRSPWLPQFGWPGAAWAGAAALSTIVLAAGGIWISAPRVSIGIESQSLQTSRGIEGFAVAQIHAGKPVVLHIDLTELPALKSYRVEIVNLTGQLVWQGVVTPQDRRIAVHVTTPLSAGQYYVRLRGSIDELLREFSLRAI